MGGDLWWRWWWWYWSVQIFHIRAISDRRWRRSESDQRGWKALKNASEHYKLYPFASDMTVLSHVFRFRLKQRSRAYSTLSVWRKRVMHAYIAFFIVYSIIFLTRLMKSSKPVLYKSTQKSRGAWCTALVRFNFLYCYAKLTFSSSTSPSHRTQDHIVRLRQQKCKK